MSFIVMFSFLFLCFRFVLSSLVCTPSSSSYLHFSSLYQVCISFLILILIHSTFSILVYNKRTAHLSIRSNFPFLLIFVSSCFEYLCICCSSLYVLFLSDPGDMSDSRILSDLPTAMRTSPPPELSPPGSPSRSYSSMPHLEPAYDPAEMIGNEDIDFSLYSDELSEVDALELRQLCLSPEPFRKIPRATVESPTLSDISKVSNDISPNIPNTVHHDCSNDVSNDVSNDTPIHINLIPPKSDVSPAENSVPTDPKISNETSALTEFSALKTPDVSKFNAKHQKAYNRISKEMHDFMIKVHNAKNSSPVSSKTVPKPKSKAPKPPHVKRFPNAKFTDDRASHSRHYSRNERPSPQNGRGYNRYGYSNNSQSYNNAANHSRSYGPPAIYVQLNHRLIHLTQLFQQSFAAFDIVAHKFVDLKTFLYNNL